MKQKINLRQTYSSQILRRRSTCPNNSFDADPGEVRPVPDIKLNAADGQMYTDDITSNTTWNKACSPYIVDSGRLYFCHTTWS